MKRITYLLFTIVTGMMCACSGDYLDTTPEQYIDKSTVFSSTDGVRNAVNGLGELMATTRHIAHVSGAAYSGEGGIKQLYGEYPGNDYYRYQTSWSVVFNSTYQEANIRSFDIYPWYYYYTLISNANIIISNIDYGKESSAEGINRLKFYKAEALTYRAYSFFMLSQLYNRRWSEGEGKQRGVILYTDDSKIAKGCSTLKETYEQIYKDLDDAIALYKESEVKRATVDNTSPDLSVAYAIYARAALTREDWSTAAQYATLAKTGYPLMSNEQYNAGFSTVNPEWIWSVYQDAAISTISYFYYMGSDTGYSSMYQRSSCISKELYKQIPSTDIRRELFLDPKEYTYDTKVGYATSATHTLRDYGRAKLKDKLCVNASGTVLTYIYAYMQTKMHSEDGGGYLGHLNLIRSSEMYLTEAEAEYHLDRENEARQLLVDLNKTSGRNPEYTCTLTGDDLLNEIKLYRRIELWGEGFNWFDYKRWGDPIVRHVYKDGGNFYSTLAITLQPEDSNHWTWVIPKEETDYNPNVTTFEGE